MTDRPQGGVTVLPSAARTATASSSPVVTSSARGAHIIITTTVLTGGASVVPTVEGYNKTTDSWYTVLTGAAITATGTVVLTVYPGVAAVNNVAVSNALPGTWRVTLTAADAKSVTSSVGANLLN